MKNVIINSILYDKATLCIPESYSDNSINHDERENHLFFANFENNVFSTNMKITNLYKILNKLSLLLSVEDLIKSGLDSGFKRFLERYLQFRALSREEGFI